MVKKSGEIMGLFVLGNFFEVSVFKAPTVITKSESPKGVLDMYCARSANLFPTTLEEECKGLHCLI